MNLTFAQRKRLTKIMLYVFTYPFCYFSDILKNAGATSNRKDLLTDIEGLIEAGCLEQTYFTKYKFFVKQLSPQYHNLLKMYQTVDKMAITFNQELKKQSLKQLH